MSKPKNNTITKDRSLLLLSIFNLILVAIVFLSIILRLRPNSFKVPIQFIVYNGATVQLGNWYSLYSIGLFIIVGYIVTFLLAKKLYSANRIFAMTTMAVYSVVALFAIFSVNSLLTLVQRV